MVKKKNDTIAIDKIVNRLIEHHLYWHERDKENSQFNYQYLRKLDSKLISALDRKVFGIKGLPDAFERAGINPLCHLSGVLYGKKASLKDKKKNFLSVLYQMILEVGKLEELNDSNINSRRTFILPATFQENQSYPVCEKHNCQLLPITFQSVYAAGRRLYGDWGSALKAAGFNYGDILRKKPKYLRAQVIEDLQQFLEQNKQVWSVQFLRKNNLALYKGIFNSHSESPFCFTNRPVMETALIEVRYKLKKEVEANLSPETFYEIQKSI